MYIVEVPYNSVYATESFYRTFWRKADVLHYFLDAFKLQKRDL